MTTDSIRGVKHPYYCTEGNYFSNDCHTEYDSWADFAGEEGDSDLDMNLVYRWDWRLPDPEDGEDALPERLLLFYMGQRKALARTVEVAVTADDEPAVRAWLTTRAEHLRSLWAPLLDGPAGAVDG